MKTDTIFLIIAITLIIGMFAMNITAIICPMKPRPKLRVILTDTYLPMAALLTVTLYTLAAWAWLGYSIINYLTH